MRDCRFKGVPASSRIIHSVDNTECYNYFHNILRVFDVLPNFLSPPVRRCKVINSKHGIYELSHELPNNLRFRILRC